MLNYFKEKKNVVAKRFIEIFNEKKQKLHSFTAFYNDYISKMTVFGTNGKMIRGCLVMLGYELFGNSDKTFNSTVVDAAVAAEIIQSSLLIHDDIMDNDDYRRNSPSMHKQFESDAGRLHYKNKDHYGKALGICAGDIGFFMAFEVLEKATNNADINSKLVLLWAQELMHVGFAQMQDIYYGFSEKNPEFDTIIQLYLYKTGRYSFSAPLVSGAIMADADDKQKSLLNNFGKAIGIAFQIKDDELGLFGNESVVGKTIGSDLKENKKTFIRAALLKCASSNKLLQLLKRKNYTQKTLDQIRKIYETCGAQKYVQDTIDSYNSKAYTIIKEVEANEDCKEILKKLVDYNAKRDK